MSTITADSLELDLWYMAHVAERRPIFVAWALRRYRTMYRLDEATLADLLCCPVDALPRLALCRMPDPASPRFRSDVRAVAGQVECDAERLEALLAETRLARVA